MDPSALSVAARHLREYLAPRLDLEISQITIGPPATAGRTQDDQNGNSQDLLNLFFFRVEYDGYPADGKSDEPFYVRAHCLLTGFCVTDTASGGLGAGEKDLRLIGSAMHWLHAEPFVSVEGADGAEVARLQIVPSHLGLDDINHLWATQGDLPYRLSVAYELALMPIPLAVAVDRQPRVGSLGLSVEERGASPEVKRLPFVAPSPQVSTSDPAWQPVARFVAPDGSLGYSLSYAVGEVPAKVNLMIAGESGVSVDLVWQRWDASSGWRALESARKTVELASGIAVSVDVPDARKGQLQLNVERSWTRPDGASVAIQSNPLLISIYTEVS